MSACGGYANSAYLSLWDLDIWELVELIEIVADLNKPPEPDTDISTLLT